MADDTIKDDDTILGCSPLSSFQIDTIDTSSILGAQGSTFTYPSTWSGNVTISSSGSGSSGNTMWSSGPYTINTAGLGIGTTNPGLTVNGDATFDGDIKWKGRSLGKLLEKIEDRLAILSEPDPEKLEKFAALKKAYEHYKLIEKLIGDD